MAVFFASDHKYTLNISVISLTLFLAICSVQGQVTSDLYPYGPGNSDRTLTNGNDLFAAVTATTQIYFYGETYNTLYVNTNGVISLGSPLPEPQTNNFFNSFPLFPDLNQDGELEKNVLIAPFWADVDTSNNRGNIYYRQSTESTLLNDVTNDVRSLFILFSDYTATWAFIATWKAVSFYNRQSSSSDPRNTFQVVLTTDGFNTFAFFRYETVQWSAGTTLNGDPFTGIPDQDNYYAVVGFNKGDGLKGYEDGFPGEVLNLPTDSNVDISGLYAFKIDSEDILPAGCQDDVTSDLYPYGPGNSDSTLTNGNDLSAAVTATTPINFYGETYNTLYVNTNGVLSLGNPMEAPQTNNFFNSFPLFPDLNQDGELEKNVLIAPFWADVDTSNNRGNIYYRQLTESTLLNDVTNDVRNLLILFSDYTATWAFIATWESVSFYNRQSSSSDPRNTFQVVLTTDGFNTFAFFRYETVQWSAGTTLNGDPETGIPDQDNHHAVVGFNKGDGLKGYEDGFPGEVLNLPTDSNVDISGLYAFKIDSEDILSAGCQDDARIVYTFPVFGNMFGGERVYLIGPCWGFSVGDDLKCRFTSSEGDELQIANGTVESRHSAYCVPEPFFLVGEVKLEVSINNGSTWNYEGVYRIVYPGRVTNLGRVTRSSSSSSIWETAGNSLTITWDTAQFEADDRLEAHVLAYREDGSGPRWEEVYTIATDVGNTGFISFTPTATETVAEDNAYGLIRVQPTNRGIGRKLYTTEHALGYVLEQKYQNNPEIWSNEKCLTWAAEDDALPTYTDSLLNCPCTLDQALTDSGRFQPDTGCSMFSGSVCAYHVGAKHCVRSVFASSRHAGTQCCYDGNGYLMYAGDTDQGSTNDRSHVWGSEPYLQADKVPSLSHWKHDVISFYYCCLWGTHCRSYMERRITMDCANYEPAEHAIAFGDPHIITFDNANYTFNGKGEFTMVEVTNPTRFRLDGRFEVIPAFTSTTEKQDGATGLTALVMLENLSDVIQVKKDAINGMKLYKGTQTFNEGNIEVVNWERTSFRDQTWLDLKGVSITINNDMGHNKVVTSLTVMFRSSSIGVNVSRLEDNEVLSVSVILPPSLKGKSYVTGIFGSYNNDAGDDLQTRYGGFADPCLATDEEIYQAGLSWRTPESTLFRYDDETFYDIRNDTNYNPLLTSPDESSLTSSELSFMDNTCGNITQCRFDFLVTRDQSIAMATSSAEEHYRWAEEKMLKMTSCTFIPTPRNGFKTYSQKEDGEVVSSYSNNFVGTIVEFQCDEDYVLEGSPKRTCQDDGTYSGSEIFNDCIYSPCGSLAVVENGYMKLSELNGYQVVTITCDQGYFLEGPSDRQCNGEDWSGVDSRCVAYEDHPTETPITDCKRNGLIAASCIEGAIIIFLSIVIATLLRKGSRKGTNERGNKSDEGYNGESNFGMVRESIDEKYRSGEHEYERHIIPSVTT